MHQPTMTALDFPRILNELASQAACQLGKELAHNTRPLSSLDAVRRAQQETSEAKSILQSGRSVPFGGIQDVRLFVERAENGTALRPDQLMAVADTIYGCRQLAAFLSQSRSVAPLLTRHAEAFGQFNEVEDEIRRCIDRGMISTRASHQLKEIRNELAVVEGRIQDRLNGILRQVRQHLQESLVTTRNGRYVIPVKASARNSVPGTMHGTSSSGSTVFIEPEVVRRLSEELEYWRAIEEAEIEQILAALSGMVAEYSHGFQQTLGAVAALDLIFARARLSNTWDARPVNWNETGQVHLRNARHPLLGRSAIGNEIRMHPASRMLIVTGPNTGGKTLLLKTLGLLVIIARCGMHIPVGVDSSLCFFEALFADIGDNQSLEQSLSTFSGHIANVAPMLPNAGPQTLILLDELGSGTDPHEGTALGIAVLEAFLARGAYTLATTHLREIKEFGRMTPGCTIAGMGFDGETLRPTYRLIYGTLGQSHGLEIAARAGMPQPVVDRARTLLHGTGVPGGLTSSPESGTGELAQPAGEVWEANRGEAPVRSEPAVAPQAYVESHAPAPAPAARPAPGLGALDASPVVTAPVSPRRARVWHGESEREMAVADLLIRRFPDGLVVGDRVRVKEGVVVEAAPRRNVLTERDADTGVESVIAANFSRILILLSARQPDFHATVLARHLLYAERHGVTPIICLTKADMVPRADAAQWLKPFAAVGYEAHRVSAVKGWGLESLQGALTGQFTAVMGYPRAGKSTLLTALGLPPEGGAPAHRSRSQNPAVFQSAGSTWLVDMPSLRETGEWKPDLNGGFQEFQRVAGQCAQPGCMHLQEKGCGVREAAEDGSLERRRYQQYVQLLRHLRLA